MAQTTTQVKILQRVDSKANWETANTKLLEKELGFEQETGRYKIGDGSTLWNDLPYNSAGQETTEGGEIFNDYEQNQALHLYCHAEGSSTRAGHKAFSFKEYNYSNADYTDQANNIGKYYLNTTNGIISGINYSVVLDNNFDYRGTVKSIGADYIEVTNYILPNTSAATTICTNDSYIIFPDNPEIQGDFIIGKSSHSEGKTTYAIGDNAHAEGRDNKAPGKNSHVEGRKNVAGGYGSHAEGTSTKAINTSAHSEGDSTLASGAAAHAEGGRTKATGDYAHAEGDITTASGRNSHAEGTHTVASGDSSHAEGSNTKATTHYAHAEGAHTQATGANAHAEGEFAQASGGDAHAEGYFTTASGGYSHAEGSFNTASSNSSHTEGSCTTASGSNAHAEGFYAIASGAHSHAEGHSAQANGNYSHAEGYYTIAQVDNQHVQGKYNLTSNTYAYILGNGTSENNRSNAHTIDWSGNAWFAGSVSGVGAYNSTGADIAELYEWEDGNPNNEDRRGLFVTLNGDKIKLANSSDDYIKGIVSSDPCLVGDSYINDWQGKYLTDIFGRKLTQTVYIEPQYDQIITYNEETGEQEYQQILTNEGYYVEQYILNPEYNAEKEYIPRHERPEYDYISSWGKVVLVDDGTCEVNGFATVDQNGVATKTYEKTPYRVMARKDDNHILVAIN